MTKLESYSASTSKIQTMRPLLHGTAVGVEILGYVLSTQMLELALIINCNCLDGGLP